MKLYYVYPFKCPYSNQLIDNYECLKNKYLSQNRYADYWNSCLRILCREYGLAISCSFNRKFEEIIRVFHAFDCGLSDNLSNLFSDIFKCSLSFKKIFCNNKTNILDKKMQVNRKLSCFTQDVLGLLNERNELCLKHGVSIFPDIKRVNYHPSVAGEMWEGGHLINEDSVYLHLINETHSNKIKR